MEKAKQHWEILQRVPEELANRVREFMVIGMDGDGVILVTEDGDGYWLGEMRFEENESKQTNEPIRLDVPNLSRMAQGNGFILLLDKSGQIHTIGENDQGQLGLGTVDQEIHYSPQLISCPHKFTSIRCGYWHSLALTEDGKVWAWGLNDWSQVGVPSFTANPLPTPCQILGELDQIVAVECGAFHTLALTSQGEVYGWGWNDWGQVGDGSESSLYTPTRIPTPSPVRSIAAGHWHSMLLTQTGEVYACGGNGWGQLGQIPTNTGCSFSWVKVAGLPRDITQIATHYDSFLSVAITANTRQCFVWGQLRNPIGDTMENQPFISIPFQLPPIYSTLDSVLSFHSNPRNTPCSVRVSEGPECLQRTDSKIQTENQLTKLN